MAQSKTTKSVLFLAHGAVIAALYVVLTYFGQIAGIPAIGPVEFRISEALTILPVFTPAAIPGLAIGCVIANLICGGVWWDVVFGSLATLIGAVGTYLLRKYKVLPFLPPVFSNTLIVTPVLIWVYGFLGDTPVWLFYLTFFAGEAASVFIFGFLLRMALKKANFKF